MADEATVEALQFLQDLMYKHEVSPRPDLESELGGVELFSTGRVAVMLNNPSAVNQFRAIEAFKWDVATLPIGKAERRGTGGGGTGWASGAATKIPDEAWGFLKHITSAQAQLDEVAVGATTPSRVSVVTSEAFLDPNKPPQMPRALPRRRNMWCATRCMSTGRRSHSASIRPTWTCCGAVPRMRRPYVPASSRKLTRSLPRAEAAQCFNAGETQRISAFSVQWRLPK